MRAARGQRGFSLVELMIAMALFAVISLGLLDTVGLFGRTQRSVAALDVAESGVRAGQELITRDIEMASNPLPVAANSAARG